eukprot:7506120-Lingulodinium_polyedra.AAC.1
MAAAEPGSHGSEPPAADCQAGACDPGRSQVRSHQRFGTERQRPGPGNRTPGQRYLSGQVGGGPL